MPTRLERPRGRHLARSNEELLKKYCKLAHWLVGRYKRRFKLSDEQADDLEHSLLVVLFQAPTSYRNPAGIHLIFRTKLQDLIQAALKHEREISAGLMQSPERCEEPLPYEDPADPIPHEQRIHDALTAPAVLSKIDALSSPERAVLGLTYGVDGCEELDDYWIARRLGKTKAWVAWKRKQAIFKLQGLMGLRETAEGL